MINRKTILPLLPQVLFTWCVMAQSLPNYQQISLRAPVEIKVDGKATEWGNKFQAYNHATDVYYTLSNDDNTLYLIIQVTDTKIARKILNGGMAFSINKKQKKDDAETISIAYPLFEKNNLMTVNFRAQPVIIPGDEKSVMKADSFATALNNRLDSKSKTIGIKGIKGLDTVISIYNENNIKVAQRFDNKMIYTCEIAVPLAKLELSVKSPSHFFYHLVINEVIEHGITVVRNDEGKITSFSSKGGAQTGQPATDFWSEYTLAK